MWFPIGCRLLVLAALVLVVLIAPAPDAIAKGKRLNCKGTKVAVKIGKKKSCQPFAKLFPKPKAGDIRLAYLEQALRFDPAKGTRGKKRTRGGALPRGFKAAAKRGQKKLLKTLPKALALIDRKGHRAGASTLKPNPALASAGCNFEEPSPIGHTGGASIGAFGDNGGYVDAPIGGGLRVRITFISCGGVSNLNVPECPKANGLVDGKGSGEFRATFEIQDGSEVVSRNSSVFEEKAKVHGEVGADAKLKFIEVEHTQEVFIVASVAGHYPIVIRGGVTRKVRIQMPGGSYDPASASARFYGDSLAPGSGADSFARTADAAIRSYRAAEGRWSSFDRKPFCAQATFSPASNTLKLKKGDSKPVSIYAKARADGGRATAAKWTLLNFENAQFNPTSSESASPTVSYQVTNAPENGFVRVKAKFTSTAGVGEDTWTQPTEKSGSIDKIAGTFSQTTVQHLAMYGDATLEVAGNVTFERFSPAVLGGASGFFKFKSGFMQLTVSGNGGMFVSAPLCSQSGSVQLGFAAESSFDVFGTGDDQHEPYEYSFSISSSGLANLPLTIYGCADVAKEQEGVYNIPVAANIATKGFHVSPDGITYADTVNEELGAVTVTENWSFTGTEE